MSTLSAPLNQKINFENTFPTFIQQTNNGNIVPSSSRAEFLISDPQLGITLNFNTFNNNNNNNIEADTLISFKLEDDFKNLDKLTISLNNNSIIYKPQSLAIFNDVKPTTHSTVLVYPTIQNNSTITNDNVPQRIIYVSVGNNPSLHSLRNSAHAACLHAKKIKSNKIIIEPLTFTIKENQGAEDNNNNSTVDYSRVYEALTKTFISSNHIFDRYLVGPRANKDKDNNNDSNNTYLWANEPLLSNEGTNTKRHRISNISYLINTNNNNELDLINNKIKQGIVIGESVLLTRELGNDRADSITPQSMQVFAQVASEVHSNLSVKVLQDEDLRKANLHLLASVGQAAKHKARLVIIKYTGDSENPSKDLIALVGKGITYDTGGLNIKATGQMEDMHMDMCGSAAVLSTMKGLAILKPKVNVVGVLALAENAVDSNSYYPHQIIPSAAGSVLISNTDAEGRLALADALTYVQNEYNPKTVIDIATLTGACIVALGEYMAGLYSTSDLLAKQLTVAGARTSDRCWRMPLMPEYAAELKTTYADFRSSAGRYGGSCIAASFLHKFIKSNVEWSHLDIAGPASLSKSRDMYPEGASGFGTELFLDFILARANQANADNQPNSKL